MKPSNTDSVLPCVDFLFLRLADKPVSIEPYWMYSYDSLEAETMAYKMTEIKVHDQQGFLFNVPLKEGDQEPIVEIYIQKGKTENYNCYDGGWRGHKCLESRDDIPSDWEHREVSEYEIRGSCPLDERFP